jgi:hypothetical protein
VKRERVLARIGGPKLVVFVSKNAQKVEKSGNFDPFFGRENN